MLPHNNIAVFINILNILSIEQKQLNEEMNERVPDDDLERSKHVGLFLIKVKLYLYFMVCCRAKVNFYP